MGRWNRNNGHERLVAEPHDDSVQPPVPGFSKVSSSPAVKTRTLWVAISVVQSNIFISPQYLPTESPENSSKTFAAIMNIRSYQHHNNCYYQDAVISSSNVLLSTRSWSSTMTGANTLLKHQWNRVHLQSITMIVTMSLLYKQE